MSSRNYQLKNYMEDVVFMMIDDVLKNVEVCKCQKCKLDIVALALNNLPPKYLVTEKGELYSKISSLQQQFEVDVISAIIKAAVLVSRAPRHEEM